MSEITLEKDTPYCDSCGKDLSVSEAFCESACVYCKKCEEESIREHNEREARKQNECNNVELLSCPFCGGKAYAELFPEMEHDRWIACLECESMSKTEEAWNRRPPAAPQWTTEPPKEEGWYMVSYSGKHTDCIEIRLDDYREGLGTYLDNVVGFSHSQFFFLEEYIEKYSVTGWCKIEFPPLPEEKESDE